MVENITKFAKKLNIYIYIYISILNKKTVVFINQQDWASVIGQFPHHPILHTSIQFFLFFFVSVSVRKREIGFQCRVQFASKLAHVVPMCLKCARDLHEFCSNSEGPIRWNLLTCVSRENLDPHLSSIIYVHPLPNKLITHCSHSILLLPGMFQLLTYSAVLL